MVPIIVVMALLVGGCVIVLRAWRQDRRDILESKAKDVYRAAYDKGWNDGFKAADDCHTWGKDNDSDEREEWMN